MSTISVTYQGKSKSFNSPGWSDVIDAARRSTAFANNLAKAIITLNPDNIIAVWCRHHISRFITPEKVAEIIPHCDISLQNMPAKIWMPVNRVMGVKFYWPKDNFENGTFREFLIMDGYLEDILEHPETADDNIMKLVASIYRAENNKRAEVIRNEDKRLPVISRENVDQWAEWLNRMLASPLKQNLKIQIQAQALSFALGFKGFIKELYGPYLFEKSAPGAESSGPQFGWTSVAMQVAEGGVFGDLEKVLDTKFHDICVYLVEKKVEHDRIIRQQKQFASHA